MTRDSVSDKVPPTMNHEAAREGRPSDRIRRLAKPIAITLGTILACVGSTILADPLGDVDESFACDGLWFRYRFSDAPIGRAPRFGIEGTARCAYSWEFDQIHTTRTVAFRTSLDRATILRSVETFARGEGFGPPEPSRDGVDFSKRERMFWVRFDERDPHEVLYVELEGSL